MHKILVAYPVDTAAGILADGLVKENYNNEVTVFVDKKVICDHMESTVSDLVNISPSVKVINNSNDWSEFQHIVFSNLNVAPGLSDYAFAESMRNLFEKHLPMKVDGDVNIVFGQNFRGLIAMHELGKLRPDLKKNCVAVSSIVFQGRQIASRGLPDIGNKIFCFGDEDSKNKLLHMAGQWSWGQFQMTEAAALVEAISSLNQGNLASLHFAGVYPQDADIQIHPDLEDVTSPIFLDSDTDPEDREKSEEYLNYMKKTDAYFKSLYTTKE